jgi:hypothetical protein
LIGSVTQIAAMLSQQIEIEGIEAFEKVRPATILADAAVRGLVPQGIPTRASVLVANSDVNPYTLAAGRTLSDAGGHDYVVDTPVTVPAGGTGTAQCLQQTQRVIAATVTTSQPFYAIPVPPAADGSFIAGISVADSAGNEFTYAPGFTNVANGQQVYTVEVDQYQNIFVKFGYGGVVGYQPAAGEVFNITVTDTVGDITIATGSPFSLDNIETPQDSLVKITLGSVLIQGQDPMDIPTLSQLSKYPSAYNPNAVYLGEFDYLIRRNVPGLLFLSVWNEQIEEAVRGANEDNINKLFVSFVPPVGGDQTAYEAQITAIIKAADDSYKIGFVAANVIKIVAAVNATIARVYDQTAVANQISDVVLKQYGQTAPAVTFGQFTVQNKVINQLLRANVPALQDSASDYSVVLAPVTGQLPEDYRYMDATSLTVTVTLSTFTNGSWGI